QVAERSKAGGDFDFDRTHVHVARIRAADLAAAREGRLGCLSAHGGDVDLLEGVAGGGVARHDDRVARLDDLDVARGHDGRGGHRVDELEGGRNDGTLGLQRGKVVQGQANGRGQDGVGGVDDQQLAVGQGDRDRARIHVDDDEVVAVGTAGGDGRDPGVVVDAGGQVGGQQAGVAEGGAVVEVHADGEAGGAAQDEVRTGQRDEGRIGNANVGVGIDDVGGGDQHGV